MAFDQLIADLKGVAEGQGSTLTKSDAAGADDANIQAAGATGGDSGTGGEGAAAAAAAEAGAGAGEGGNENEDGELAKSFEVQLENGQKFQAVDATELLKSLNARVGDVETSAGEALGLCVELIKSQGAQIADLHAQVKKLAGSGTGRMATLAIVPRDSQTAAGGAAATRELAKSEQTISAQDFLLKAEAAFNAEKLPGRDLALIESHINRGEKLPAALIQKVMAATGATA